MNIFRLKNEERWIALVALLVVATLLWLMVRQYSPLFLKGGNLGYWTIFSRHFRMSGYDCWSYITLSNLRIHFETSRHPFFLSVLYPLYLLNQQLMDATESNHAVYLVGALTTFCAVYSLVFIYRLHREIMGLSLWDGLLLTLFFYSFAHVMVAMLVPDHFVLSLFLLSLTLYLVGKAIRERRRLPLWQWTVLLFLTAGVTLTNGAKTVLAALFVDGKKVFRWQMVVFGVALPLAALVAIYLFQYHTYEVPQQQAIHHIEKKQQEKIPDKVAKRMAQRDRWMETHSGKPVADLPLLKMTDVTTSRIQTLVENVFGESIQLHRDHLLEDVSFTRPVFVGYRSAVNYVVEAVIVLLFVVGLWVGRHDRFMLMVMSWMLVDVMLHLVLGFGINEVYIMSADWIFIIPLALACLFRLTRGPLQMGVRVVTWLLTLYLLVWNGTLLIHYLRIPYTQLIR
uniref:Glycosyltransferase RgtA/B/C/D-like domain-containing protein n=1 Tax=Prevotella sp. GTC17262 TaxID=3236797 RepID=A0AB33JP12_9BACT